MKYVTLFVTPDEPCFGLKESAEGDDWVQHCWVNRDDTLADYMTVIGPASDYSQATPLTLIEPFGDQSVGALMEEAEKFRHDDYGHKRLQRLQSESTLVADAIDQNEQRHNMLHNKTVMGPAGSHARNGFSRVTSQRQIKQNRRDRRGKFNV